MYPSTGVYDDVRDYHHREYDISMETMVAKASSHSRDDDVGEIMYGELLHGTRLPTTIGEMNELNDEFDNVDPRRILLWAGRRMGIHLDTAVVSASHPPNGDVSSGSGSDSGGSTATTTTTIMSATTKMTVRRVSPLIQVTSLGLSGLVISHMLNVTGMIRDVPIVTLDTLHLFSESYEYYDTMRQRYRNEGMEFVVIKPVDDGGDVIETREDFDDVYGETLWRDDADTYAKLTKVDPLRRWMRGRTVRMWITGRRRSTGRERRNMRVLEYVHDNDDHHDHHDDVEGGGDDGSAILDAEGGTWKLNPLAHWTYDDVWRYIREHDIPYNSLFDAGYTSIGDVMTTDLPRSNYNDASSVGTNDAVDGYERSGRFVALGANRTECGLHSHRGKVDGMMRRRRDREYEGGTSSQPSLRCDACTNLNIDNFITEITKKDDRCTLLIEFYSPWCGGCQDFAPTYDRIAHHLRAHHGDGIRAARFDVSRDDVPLLNDKVVFSIEKTPTLYRVRHVPSFRVGMYEGERDFDSIVSWMTSTHR